MYGGPAPALSLAIVTDEIPPARRGRAMATVLGAFAVASVIGVPAGLELSHLGGWRTPFFAVALVGLLVFSGVFLLMPPLTRHLAAGARSKHRITGLLRKPEVVAALGASALVMLGHFTLVPNLAAFFQFNYGYPRDGLGLLYFVGGSISFATMRIAGWLADRVGTTRVVSVATVFYVAVLFISFISPAHVVPVLVLFAGFMITSSFRAVPMRALSSRVPLPEHRARYMSSQSVVDHLAGATGAMLGSSQLHELADGRLEGMDRLAWITVGLSLSVPLLLAFVERRVKSRERAAAAATAPPVPTPPVHLEVT
jgi:predicted MFS family arabinose efflux permease